MIWCGQQLIPRDLTIHSRFSRPSVLFCLSECSLAAFSRTIPQTYRSSDLQKSPLKFPEKSEKHPKLFVLCFRCSNIRGGMTRNKRGILLGGSTISWPSNSFLSGPHWIFRSFLPAQGRWRKIEKRCRGRRGLSGWTYAHQIQGQSFLDKPLHHSQQSNGHFPLIIHFINNFAY